MLVKHMYMKSINAVCSDELNKMNDEMKTIIYGQLRVRERYIYYNQQRSNTHLQNATKHKMDTKTVGHSINYCYAAGPH